MNLQPIEVSWSKARETLRQYGSILKEKRTAEDLAILKSTKAILADKMVIRLADAVKNGGVDNRGLPKIAIVRADDTYCRVKSRGATCEMAGMSNRNDTVSDWHTKRNSYFHRRSMTKPRGFKFKLSGRFQDSCEAVAVVPTIPPAHRPPPTAYDNYYILFEALWEAVPPVDPALLAPLGCGLFVVVAVWDLTGVERAVLANSRGL
jgi:hypothetical protein